MGVGVAAGSASQIAADLTPLSTFLRSLFATQQIVQPPYLAINLIFNYRTCNARKIDSDRMPVEYGRWTRRC